MNCRKTLSYECIPGTLMALPIHWKPKGIFAQQKLINKHAHKLEIMLKRKDIIESIPLVAVTLVAIYSVLEILVSNYTFDIQQHLGLTLLLVSIGLFFADEEYQLRTKLLVQQRSLTCKLK